ncbi:MAG: DUF5069 domain-containing protein [Opitutaceae bacterium]
MPNHNPLRRPWDDSIADCMWLARLTDKTRLHLDGNLNADFEPFFGHKLGTDGEFFRFFEIDLETLIAIVRNSPTNDQAVAAWFISRPSVTDDRITAWNADAFDLGKSGHSMSRAFSWAKRKYYGGDKADPAVVSVFSGIAWDEGYLDEMPTDQ